MVIFIHQGGGGDDDDLPRDMSDRDSPRVVAVVSETHCVRITQQRVGK